MSADAKFISSGNGAERLDGRSFYFEKKKSIMETQLQTSGLEVIPKPSSIDLGLSDSQEPPGRVSRVTVTGASVTAQPQVITHRRER